MVSIAQNTKWGEKKKYIDVEAKKNNPKKKQNKGDKDG